MLPILARSLYFSLQRFRGGVTPAVVRAASQVLAAPRGERNAYVALRLAAVHGEDADVEWLARQPLVERSTLLAEISRLRAMKLDRRVEARKTSGSTGTPFAFLKDVEMTSWMDGTMWALYAWHGIRPGDRQARFWGMPMTPWLRRKRRAIDWVMHRRRLSAFDIAPDRCARFFRELRRFRASHAYGYPTLMVEFATQCEAAGLDGRELGLRVVISTGELLSPEVRKRLERFFGCRVVNEYGCTESGVIAIECEHGTMHLTPVAAYAEIVAPDGAPVPPGERGEVVVTDLFGAVLPLTRYRLHDRASRSAITSCECGRDLDAIDVEVGRLDRFIQTPDRGLVYDAILAYNVPTEVLRFRAHQTAIDRLYVEVLPGAGFDERKTPEVFRQRLAAALGQSMRIEIRVVTDIPFSASGKLRYFVPLASSPQADTELSSSDRRA